MKNIVDYKFLFKFPTLCFIFCVHLKAYGQVKNYALDFPGVNSPVVNLGNIDALNGASRFTFECRIKLDAWNTDSEIFNKTQDEHNRIGIQLGPEDKKRLYFHLANGSAGYVAVEHAPVSLGQWHHIVMAYDGSQPAKSQMTVYIDGA